MESVTTTLTSMLAMGTTVLEWCCTTFPINVAVAGGVIGIVFRVVRGGKRVAH